MNRIDDERLLFYLRNRELIDEWAAIRDDLMRAANAFYLSIGTELAERAVDLGGDVLVNMEDGTWAQVGLHRDSWARGDSDAPVIAINLEWNSKSAGFTHTHRICGLRASVAAEGGAPIHAAVTERIASERARLGFPRYSRDWPAYRDIADPSGDEWWTDLKPFRTEIVDAIVDAWDKLSGYVDDVLKSN